MTIGTKAAYAAKIGKTKGYLSNKKTRLMLEPAMEVDPADGLLKINFEKADAIFAQNRDPSRYLGKKPRAAADDDEPAPQSFESAKRERELVKLQHDTLDLLDRKGKLIPKKTVEDACAVAGQIFREHLQARNKRLADKISTMKDAREIKVLMDEDDRMILEQISDALMRKLYPEAGEPGQLALH